MVVVVVVRGGSGGDVLKAKMGCRAGLTMPVFQGLQDTGACWAVHG